jgi:hypothetical protein
MTDATDATKTVKKATHETVKCPLCNCDQRKDHLGRHLCRGEHLRQLSSAMTEHEFDSLKDHPIMFKKNADGIVTLAVCCACEKAYTPKPSDQCNYNWNKFVKQHKSDGCFAAEKVKALREKQKKHLIKSKDVIGAANVNVVVEEGAPVGETYDQLLERYEHNKAVAIEREAELEAEIAALKKKAVELPPELVKAIHDAYAWDPDSDEEDEEEPTVLEKMASLIGSLKFARRTITTRNKQLEAKDKQIQGLEMRFEDYGLKPYAEEEDEDSD